MGLMFSVEMPLEIKVQLLQGPKQQEDNTSTHVSPCLAFRVQGVYAGDVKGDAVFHSSFLQFAFAPYSSSKPLRSAPKLIQRVHVAV